MHGQTEASTFRDDKSEEIVLKELIFVVRRWNLSVDESGIHLFSRRTFDFIETECTQICDLEFLSDSATLFMPFERGSDDETQIFIETLGQRFEASLFLY